jgi:hypothetical protein
MPVKKNDPVQVKTFMKPLLNREIRKTRAIFILTLVCLAVVAISPAMAIAKDPWGTMPPPAPTPSVHQKSNQEIMKEFGVDVLTNAPAEIKTGSNSQKAKYAFTQYCNKLADAKTPVNANYAGRALQLFTHGKADRWTCSDHSLNLQGLFQGMGIRDNDMVMVIADSDSMIPSANSDHGVLVVRDNNGKPYVFDAWAMAVENLNTDAAENGNYEVSNGGSFLYSGAERSNWNGMDVGDWGNTMTSAGYVRFTADGGGSWNTSSSDAANTWFNNLPDTYPSSFTFVIYPKGGGATTRLLYNYPITVNDKGVVSAVYHTEGASPYIQTHNTETTSLADLSVTGTYDKKTGKISGEFTSNEIHQSSPSQQYDCWAKGTFTGQMVKGGKTMTTFLEGSAYYYVLDTTPGSNRKTGPVTSKYELPFTAAAVVSNQSP